MYNTVHSAIGEKEEEKKARNKLGSLVRSRPLLIHYKKRDSGNLGCSVA